MLRFEPSSANITEMSKSDRTVYQSTIFNTHSVVFRPMTLLYAGTDEGLWTFRLREESLDHLGTTLADHAVREVEPDPEKPTAAFAACGLRGEGLHRVTDRGTEAKRLGLADEWVWGVTVTPDGTLLVGTEPPRVYRSDDGGETLEAAPSVAALAEDADWFFWSEPHEAGHVHGFGVHPDRPQRVLAGVEIGGALRSDDGGETWTTIDDLSGEDVHNVAPHPTDPDRWYAATGGGLVESADGGESWGPVPPLANHYVAKVAFDADNRPCVSAAPDSSADEGTVWRRDDEWRPLHTSPADSLSGMLAAHPSDAQLLVHTESTPEECRLLVTRDGGETWHGEGPVLPRVRTLAMAEE